jgi:hypothetical protein
MSVNRKLRLKEMLIQEREMFMANGINTKDHDIAIAYLENGFTAHSIKDSDLLEAIMHDFETICSDYDV